MTDIIEYNNKKYKKQPNGKWLEVSKYGAKYITKSEHLSWGEYFKRKAQEKRNDGGGYAAGHYQEDGEWHKKQASKLSDKEYSEEELILFLVTI